MLSEFPDHKPIRLKPFNYLGQHFYFVTTCTFQRRAIFSDTKLSHRLLSLLRMERQQFVQRARVLPDARSSPG